MAPFPTRFCPVCHSVPRTMECMEDRGWHVECWRLEPEHWVAVFGVTRTLAILAWDEAFQNGQSRLHT